MIAKEDKRMKERLLEEGEIVEEAEPSEAANESLFDKYLSPG
jgi:hypothetical protein